MIVPEIEQTPEQHARCCVDELEHEAEAMQKHICEATKNLEFEKAAELRGRLKTLRAAESRLR